MIKNGEPNPLNIFNLRRFEHCAPHLEKVCFDSRRDDKTITDWIYENLEGRFYFGDIVHYKDNKYTLGKCAAFEIKSEATYFCFMLDSFNSTPDLF
jgi:hypothetical protein